MKKQSIASRLFAVLMAVLMVCTVVPATSFSYAAAAKTTTSAAATKKMSKVKVAYTKSLVYTGKARKPKVTVTYGKATLKKDKDYTVSYKNNTEIGVAQIVIKAKAGSGYTGTKTVKFKIVPAKVRGVKAAKVTQTAAKLTWTAVKGAKGYIVYRYDAKTKTYTKIKATKKLALTVKNLEAGKVYRFAVRAYTKNGKNYYGVYSKAIKVKTLKATVPTDPTNPTTPTGTVDPTNPVNPTTPTNPTNPTTPTNPTNPTNPTTPTNPTNPTNPTTPTNPTNPTKPTNPTNPTNPTSPTTPSVTVAKVTGLKANIGDETVTFTWTTVTNATGYELAQFDAAQNKYILKSAVTGTSAKLSNLEENQTYLFAVRAYTTVSTGDKVYGAYSDQVSVKIIPETPVDPGAIEKVANVKATKKDAVVTLTWDAVAKATGYEIATIDGTKYTKVATSTTTSAKLDKLERHKQLQLVVRAYVTSAKKNFYGDYSDPVSAIVYNADYVGAAFRAGCFRMSMTENLDGVEQPITMACKNGNVYFTTTMSMTDTITYTAEMLYIKNTGKIYMKMGRWGDVTELFKNQGDLSGMTGMFDMTERFSELYFGNGSDVVMSTETVGGKTYDVETVKDGSETVKLYTQNNQLRLLQISHGADTETITLTDFSAEVDDALFKTPSLPIPVKDEFSLLLIM